MRDKPRPERRALTAWYRHVEAVGSDLKRAAEAPPWWRRMWHDLGEYFGFNLKAELRGLLRLLLDLDDPERWITVRHRDVERAHSELAVVATALRMVPPDRWDYEARVRLSHRLDRARALLEEGLLTEEIRESALQLRQPLVDLDDLLRGDRV
jgi:hypothetical protein